LYYINIIIFNIVYIKILNLYIYYKFFNNILFQNGNTINIKFFVQINYVIAYFVLIKKLITFYLDTNMGQNVYLMDNTLKYKF